MPESSKSASKSAKRKGVSTSDVLHNAAMALEIAKECAPLVPVPFIGSIFASAKVIVDAAGVRVFTVSSWYVMTVVY